MTNNNSFDWVGDDWPEEHQSSKPNTDLPEVVSRRPISPGNRRERPSNETNKRKLCWSEQGNIYRRRRRYQRSYEAYNNNDQTDETKKYRTPKRFLARFKKIKTDSSDSMEFEDSSSNTGSSYDEKSQDSMESEAVNNIVNKIDVGLILK